MYILAPYTLRRTDTSVRGIGGTILRSRGYMRAWFDTVIKKRQSCFRAEDCTPFQDLLSPLTRMRPLMGRRKRTPVARWARPPHPLTPQRLSGSYLVVARGWNLQQNFWFSIRTPSKL